MKHIARACLLVLLAAPVFAHTDGQPDGDCSTVPPELSADLAAMRAPATSMEAITGLGHVTGLLALGRRYDGLLVPQEAVKFPVAPTRDRPVPGAKAGIFHFSAAKAGRYRVSLTSRHWIDILIDGKSIDSVAHRGHMACSVLHKVVEFDLPASNVILLQLSGGTDGKVGIVITGPA